MKTEKLKREWYSVGPTRLDYFLHTIKAKKDFSAKFSSSFPQDYSFQWMNNLIIYIFVFYYIKKNCNFFPFFMRGGEGVCVCVRWIQQYIFIIFFYLFMFCNIPLHTWHYLLQKRCTIDYKVFYFTCNTSILFFILPLQHIITKL